MRKIRTRFEKLSNIRIRNGLTIAELSRITNLSRTGLAKIENGKQNPSPKTAKIIADALEVEFDELFEIVES